MFKVMVTGHRPNRLFGYNIHSSQYEALRKFFQDILDAAKKKYVVIGGISGMALGADMIFAEEVVNRGIPLLAYIPFQAQASLWNASDQKRYNELLSYAYETHISGELRKGAPKYEVSALLMKRNRDMVDACDLVLAVWNGATDGGTYACLQYAKEQKKRIIVFNPQTSKVVTL
jgi:uncharacterized phage-like protein YoqJ